jgi:hypothetical protein
VKRWLGLGAAGLALAAAVILLLLALDVRRWEHRVAADDVAVTVNPGRQDLWRLSETIPFGAARRMLGLDDALAYRQALQLFALGQPWFNAELVPLPVQQYRKLAQLVLGRLVQHDHDPGRRSRELNMLGALSTVTVTPYDPAHRLSGLVHAATSYHAAVIADDRDDAAKFNLEVTLRLISRVPNAQKTLSGLGGSATGRLGFGMGY